MTDNAELLVKFMEEVWNTGDVAAVDRFLAEQYSIHSDPGDPWDGQTLSREGFKNRLTTSRAPFPDLRFDLGDIVAEGDRVAVSWIMRGAQLGALVLRDRRGTGLRPFPSYGAVHASLGVAQDD